MAEPKGDMIWERYESYSASSRYYPYRRRSHTGGWIFKIKKRRRDSKYLLTVRKHGKRDLVHRSLWKNPDAARKKADKLLA